MDKKNSAYYDIEIEFEEALVKNGFVEDIFYLRDLKQRKLFISTNICQETVDDAIRHIMQINREDMGIARENRKPIILYVISNGGDVDAGFALVDVILSSKTPVYTVNLGYQYSMGFLIGLAGHKRFALPNAKFLHHDGTNVLINSGTKIKDQMEFQDKIEARIKRYVISRTKVTDVEYDTHLRQEWYLFADEAKKYGMIDYIIGVDCDMDSVI